LQKGVTLGAYLSTPACKETSQTSFSNILTSRWRPQQWCNSPGIPTPA
jgi:hypothetical protein